MSILVVQLTDKGLLFAADRNITVSVERGRLVHQGQSQRPKVFSWPNRDAIIGYVGEAMISGEPTDEWLYRRIIGEHLDFRHSKDVADDLTDRLNAAFGLGGIDGPLIIHLGTFEDEGAGVWAPVVWFIRNTAAIDPDGAYRLDDQFTCTEELHNSVYFGNRAGPEIRAMVAPMWRYFSFRQGFDLAAFNALDSSQREAIRAIIEQHPGQPLRYPASLEEWARHLRFAVLSYGAYFAAYYEPFEQFVGGGADVVWARWPD